MEDTISTFKLAEFPSTPFSSDGSLLHCIAKSKLTYFYTLSNVKSSQDEISCFRIFLKLDGNVKMLISVPFRPCGNMVISFS